MKKCKLPPDIVWSTKPADPGKLLRFVSYAEASEEHPKIKTVARFTIAKESPPPIWKPPILEYWNGRTWLKF